jgi:hypothetical protein
MEDGELGVELGEIELPRYELSRDAPAIPLATYLARLESAETAAAASGLDALVVYADREHFANLAYLTGFEPRFEEALLVLVRGRPPRLVVGNECEAYAAVSPVELEVVRYQSFSLVSQPRAESAPLAVVLRDAGLDAKATARVGIAGWKYFEAAEFAEPETRLDTPAFIVDEVRQLGCTPVNASGLFNAPGRGLRLVNEVDQLAYVEFAASHGSEAMRRMIFGVETGMTEFEAFSLYRPIGLPFCYHPVVSSGERTALGVASPSGRELRRGDPMSAGFGYWGSNTARGGFLVEDPGELPEAIRDYLERLVAPYFATAVDWYETIGIGVTGADLFDLVSRRLGDPFFGVQLNPGHFIHLDEWPSSPVFEGSSIALQSGMALQLDIIPATGTAYHTTNIEDGVALADEPMRAELRDRFPEMWSRIELRRSFMLDELGIRLKPEVLPLSGLAGYLPPFWLAPRRAMRRTGRRS